MVSDMKTKTRQIGELAAIVLVILTVVGTMAAIFSYEAYRSRERNAIDLEALPIATWSRTEIRVRKGEPARIRLSNRDTVIHGFAIPALDVDETILYPGDNAIVEFVPDRVGEFQYECTVQCDRELHAYMIGRLIVEE